MKRIVPGIIAIAFIIGAYFLWYASSFPAGDAAARFFADLFTPYDDLRARIEELERENRDLKNQAFVAGLREGEGTVAKVFSSYPLNSDKSIAIDIGSSEGVTPGDWVTYGETVFIGTVTEVRSHTSIVRTIFDPDREIPVRIGPEEVDGLLKGGTAPSIDLIPAASPVSTGDIVYTAGADLPYGLEIGRVESVSETVGEPFKKAVVTPAAFLNTIRNVVVHK